MFDRTIDSGRADTDNRATSTNPNHHDDELRSAERNPDAGLSEDGVVVVSPGDPADVLDVRPVDDLRSMPFSPRTLQRWVARYPGSSLCVLRPGPDREDRSG